MNRVTLNLYAGFRQCVGGQASVSAAIEPGDTIETLLCRYEVPIDQVRIVFCDHRLAGLDHPLQGGETVGAFPAIGGG